MIIVHLALKCDGAFSAHSKPLHIDHRPQLCPTRDVAASELVSLPSWQDVVSLPHGVPPHGILVRFSIRLFRCRD